MNSKELQRYAKKAKKLGDTPAFPVPKGGPHPGMTYRQWLVGQALKGLLANPHHDWEKVPAGLISDYTEIFADNILEGLVLRPSGIAGSSLTPEHIEEKEQEEQEEGTE